MKRFFSDLATPLIAALLVAGHFGVWASHRTAALSLTGHELGEFTHFTPGAGIFANAWFYLPVWSIGIVVALAAARAGRAAAWMAMTAGALFVAQFGIPRFERWSQPDFRVQLAAAVAVLATTVLISVGVRLSRKADAFPIRLAAAALPLSAAIPLAGYLAVRPFIEALYRDSVGLGAGWWTTLAGFALAGAHVAVIARRRNASPKAAQTS